MVIGILATLVGLAIPYYQDYAEQSRIATLQNNLYQLRKALIACHADNRWLPANSGELNLLVDGVGAAKNRYFQVLPVDPTTGLADWNYTLIDLDAGKFTIVSRNPAYVQY